MSIKHAEIPAYGTVAGTSVTGAYQTVLAPADDLVAIEILNSCDEELIVTLDGGTTDHLLLAPYQSWAKDFRAFDRHLEKPTVQVKHNGTQPTVGRFTVSGIRL